MTTMVFGNVKSDQFRSPTSDLDGMSVGTDRSGLPPLGRNWTVEARATTTLLDFRSVEEVMGPEFSQI